MWVDSKLDPLHVCDLKDFQGRAITHITKAMWVDSKLDPLHVCDLKDFQGRAITHITKAMWVDSKLDPLQVCDLKDFQGQISKTPFVVKPTVTLTFDRPWPWTRIVKVKSSESYISATRGSLDLERKGYESDTMLYPLCQLELWPQL